MQRLAFDGQLRDDPRYASIGIDDLLVHRLREALAGRADNAELFQLVGHEIERFRAAGNIDALKGAMNGGVLRVLYVMPSLRRLHGQQSGMKEITRANPLIRSLVMRSRQKLLKSP